MSIMEHFSSNIGVLSIFYLMESAFKCQEIQFQNVMSFPLINASNYYNNLMKVNKCFSFEILNTDSLCLGEQINFDSKWQLYVLYILFVQHT